MATVTMDATDAIAALSKVVKNLGKEIQIVNGKTVRRGKSIAAKEVTQAVSIPQKVVRRSVKSELVGERSAVLSLEKSKRISLKEFGARQGKKGVSYKIDKASGRKTVVGTFVGPKVGLTSVKLRGHVFKRKGKSRLPILKLKGPSPWGVIKKNNRAAAVKKKLQEELRKQMAERLRYQKLKASGAI